MKKAIACLFMALILAIAALPVTALSSGDEPWNNENSYDVLIVSAVTDDTNHTVTVDFNSDMSFYSDYEVFILKLGANDKYTVVGSSKKVTNPTEQVTFEASYFTKLSDYTKDEYKAAVIATEINGNEKYYAYGESFGFFFMEPGDFGATVSGTVTSFLEEIDPVTVTLYETMMPDALYKVTLYGNSARYSIGCQADAVTMTVSKNNHAVRTYKFQASGNTAMNVKLHPYGDINGDGEITTIDYATANAHAKGARLITDDYLISVADVTGGDGEITTLDAARINAAAKGTRALW